MNEYSRQERGSEFVEKLIEILKCAGWRIKRTPKSNDYGVDIIIEEFPFNNHKIAIQCKNFASRDVSIKAVQEIYAGKDFYDCDEAWVIANGNYTKSAVKLAEKIGVRLINEQHFFLELLESSYTFKEYFKSLPFPQFLLIDVKYMPMIMFNGEIAKRMVLYGQLFKYNFEISKQIGENISIAVNTDILETTIEKYQNQKNRSKFWIYDPEITKFERKNIFLTNDILNPTHLLRDFNRIDYFPAI